MTLGASLLSTQIPPKGPVRRFFIANLVNTVGSGIFLTTSFLAFTRGLGLEATFATTALGAGFALGLPVSLLVGRVNDRLGARHVYAVLLGGQALAMLSYGLASTPTAFAVVAVTSGILDRGLAATSGALIHDLAEPSTRTLTRARLRVSTNVGIALGSGIGALVLSADTTQAYVAGLQANGLLFAVALVCVLTLPVRSGPRSRTDVGRRLRLLPDVRYVVAIVGNALLSVNPVILTVGLPLWLTTVDVVPLASLSVVVVCNTALVILLQVSLARRVTDARSARRASAAMAVAFSASCVLLTLLPGVPTSAAVVVLAAWVVLFTVGELLQSAVAFHASFELAPDGQQGMYQSFYALGPGLSRAAGPLVLTLLVQGAEQLSWLVLAGVFVLGHLITSLALRMPHPRTP